MGDGRAAANDGIVRSAVYRLCSRINHACRPNCFAAWCAARAEQTVHALRDISAGEEISVAYVGGAEAGVRDVRRKLLREKYGFECGCSACILDGAELTASDTRQSRIHQIHGMLGPTPPPNLPLLVQEHIQLMREEGLPLIWSRAGVILSIVQLKERGELAEAAALAKQGAEFAAVALGTDSSVYLRFERLATAFAAAASAEPAANDDVAAGSAAASTPSAAESIDAEADADADGGSSNGNNNGSSLMYETGEGHQSIERGPPSDRWDEASIGPRVLHFQLLSHRRRWAQRVWPAAQVLAKHLDAQPELVRERRVLEIGAGAALPSVVASLLGAAAVVVTDYPDERMLKNMVLNLDANLRGGYARERSVVIGYDWNASPSIVLDALASLLTPQKQRAAGDGGDAPRFDVVLLSDLLYECEHEPILTAIAACLEESKSARALLTFQVHDRCQLPKQMAFFELAPSFGLATRKLETVTVGRQFEEEDEEEEEEDEQAEEDDVTAQVQLWEVVRA